MELQELSDTVVDKFLEHSHTKHIFIIMQVLPAEDELIAHYVDRSSLIICVLLIHSITLLPLALSLLHSLCGPCLFTIHCDCSIVQQVLHIHQKHLLRNHHVSSVNACFFLTYIDPNNRLLLK
jgi:hypothetical protein